MPAETTPEAEQHKDMELRKRETLRAFIGGQVMQTLGQPGNLLMVQVRPLWEDRYRVNVFVGADIACAKVAHSYFLAADGDGKILRSTPQIAKRY